MRKTPLILLVGFLIMTACHNKETSNNNSTFIWNIDPTNSKTMDLSKIFDSIYLAPLETKDECLIKRITSMVYDNGKFYINNNLSDLQVYDSTGHFMYNTFKHLGQGPKNYLSILSFRPLSNDTIELFDAVAKKVHYYHHSQGLICSYELPNNLLPVRERAVINKDTCAFAGGKNFLRFYSKKKNKFIKHIDDNQEGRFIKLSDSFNWINENLYISSTYPSNELYVFDEQLNKQCILKLDFGQYNFYIDNIPQDMNQRESAQYYSTHNNWVYPFAKYVLNNGYMTFFQFKETLHMAYLNKKTNKSIVLKNKIGQKPQLMVPNLVTKDMLFYGSEPGYLPYLIDTKLMNSHEIAKIEKIKEDDNPVIIIYKLKNNE